MTRKNLTREFKDTQPYTSQKTPGYVYFQHKSKNHYTWLKVPKAQFQAAYDEIKDTSYSQASNLIKKYGGSVSNYPDDNGTIYPAVVEFAGIVLNDTDYRSISRYIYLEDGLPDNPEEEKLTKLEFAHGTRLLATQVGGDIVRAERFDPEKGILRLSSDDLGALQDFYDTETAPGLPVLYAK